MWWFVHVIRPLTTFASYSKLVISLKHGQKNSTLNVFYFKYNAYPVIFCLKYFSTFRVSEQVHSLNNINMGNAMSVGNKPIILLWLNKY